MCSINNSKNKSVSLILLVVFTAITHDNCFLVCLLAFYLWRYFKDRFVNVFLQRECMLGSVKDLQKLTTRDHFKIHSYCGGF